MRRGPVVLLILALGAAPAAAQGSRLAGTWKAETPDGPREVTIRPDSSASYGDETVRWRAVGDSIHIAFGDEWVVYGFRLNGTRLTLSGGDLEEPISLRRTGPPKPRPDSIALPPAPPADQRAPVGPPGAGGPSRPYHR
jgi:hypothetical protein